MKILRTGRDGQVRFELQRSLAPLGEVVAVDHADCDLSDAQAIRNLVARVRPDVIVSPAAYTAVDKAESDQDRAAAINVVAPGILGEEAAQLVRQWQREGEGAFPYGTYHCVTGGETNWCDYARYVIGAAIRSGKPLKMQPEGIKPITTADYPTPAKRPAKSRLDTRKFRDTFGLELPHWQAGSSQRDQPRREKRMRLTAKEQSAIREAIREADSEASIYLFGSRADDIAKGGDIDLLVLSKKITLMVKLGILAQLHQKLGERKIDIAVYQDDSRSFPRMVMQKGVRL